MQQSDILGIFQDAMVVTLKLAAPLLVVSIVIGLVIAIFQAATQIHEQTLTFVPKIIATIVILWALGSWMIGILTEFIKRIFEMITML